MEQIRKAVIYARYSSSSQTEQSIDGQLSVCEKYAKEHDILIVNTYIDRAISGKTDNRDALQKLLLDVKTEHWDCVLVYKGDRFARNRIDNAINKKILRDNGCKLISCTENIPDSPEGIILESLLEGMAEYYSAELSQKVKRGLNESLKKGNAIGGYKLFGYDVKDKKYVINEEEASIIREAYQMHYKQRKPISEINKILSDKYHLKKDRNWWYRTLVNTKYFGKATINGVLYENMYPAIIDEETYKLMIQKTSQASIKEKYSSSDYLLTNLAYCGICGEVLNGESGIGKNGTKYEYYKCRGKKKHLTNCDLRNYKKDDLEETVIKCCIDTMENGIMDALIQKAVEVQKKRKDNDIELKMLNKKIAETQKGIDNLVKAIEIGIFTKSTADRLKELEYELDALKMSYKERQEVIAITCTPEEYYAYLKRFLSQYNQHRQFISALINVMVERVDVWNDKVRVTFRQSPFPTNDKDKNKNSSVEIPLTPPNDTNPNILYFYTLYEIGCYVYF